MSEHTPGPWAWIEWLKSKEFRNTFVLRIIPVDAYGNTRVDGPIADVHVIAALGVECAKANANLIAAAPDLLAVALEDAALDAMYDTNLIDQAQYYNRRETNRQARDAAIAKARGE